MFNSGTDLLLDCYQTVAHDSQRNGILLTHLEIWTMDLFRALLSIVTFLLYVVGPIASYRLCGRELADGVAAICKGRGYYIHDSEIAQKDSPLLPHRLASSFLGSSSGSVHSRQRRRVRTGRIVNECCDKECSHQIMESYCNKRTPEIPPESAVSENPSEGRTEDSTLRTNDESTERRTDDANAAAILEVPRAEENAPDATATSDVERPQPEATTAAEKPKKGKGKNSSSESSTKKNRTSKGMSKEERRRIASEERRASRERKKEMSRERRKLLKQQQRKDKKKKKRLESAERNRGTDHMALSEDSTLLAREPLGIDVRKRFHHTPRSSREHASTATHVLEDSATSRQERRRTQSRQSSRERKTHRTTAAAETALDETQRDRRNVFQRLTGLFRR